MKDQAAQSSAGAVARSERFHRWRTLKDKAARWGVSIGGVGVIAAIVLIFFYLLYVVFPLFLPAQVESTDSVAMREWQQAPAVYLALEEQQRVGLRIAEDGTAVFFDLLQRRPVLATQLSLAADDQIVDITTAVGDTSTLQAALLASGEVFVFQQEYRTDYSAGVENRSIVPSLRFPLGEEKRQFARLMTGSPLAVAMVDDEDGATLAVLSAGGEVVLERLSKELDFLTDEVRLDSEVFKLELQTVATDLALSRDQRWLYVGAGDGTVYWYDLRNRVAQGQLKVSDVPVTRMEMLLGGISVLVGDANGTISQVFPVRDAQNDYHLKIVRQFTDLSTPISQILPEQRRKGFVAITSDAQAAIYHSTANQLVKRFELNAQEPLLVALAPRANGLLAANDEGYTYWKLDNEHPEVSLSSLWGKVWYENYSEPQYVWQSSAANNDFEPKFSLTPLAFGTIKAAFYAMLFAIPLALLGAAYTAFFMAPEMRKLVKPTIEIMEALPTVILGFLAGLWFAPFVEENLAGIFTLLLVVPVGLLLFAWCWTRYAQRWHHWVPAGWQPALLIPVVVLLTWFGLQAAGPLEVVFFAGDMRSWMSSELGISYDQRNAMVVGFAMGFAVIPTIFSIAEDAIFGVPKSLPNGALALGSTPWQTLVRVVLPTASPGIFSGLMIGLGRAVGETMIVLMATGNTPVMDWNIFEGMRTLSANIAVEMPESEVASTHFRILFLAALVLFLFTFIVNTGAEIIRQRLRDKYSSL